MVNSEWPKKEVDLGDREIFQGVMYIAVYESKNCQRCAFNNYYTHERPCKQMKCNPHSDGNGTIWIEYIPLNK